MCLEISQQIFDIHLHRDQKTPCIHVLCNCMHVVRAYVTQQKGVGYSNEIIALRNMLSVALQWNLRIKDTLGAEVLSSFRRLSSGGRFEPIGHL